MRRVTIINLDKIANSIERSVLPLYSEAFPKYVRREVRHPFTIEEGKIGTIRILCNNISLHPLYKGIDPFLISLSEFQAEDPCDKLIIPHEIKDGGILLIRIREPFKRLCRLRRFTHHSHSSMVYYEFETRHKKTRLWYNPINGFSIEKSKWYARFPTALDAMKKRGLLDEEDSECYRHLWWYNM